MPRSVKTLKNLRFPAALRAKVFKDQSVLVVGSFRVIFDYSGKFDENGKEIIDSQKIGTRGDVYK